MSWQRFRTYLLLVSVLTSLGAAGAHAGATVRSQLPASHDETRPQVMQAEANSVASAPVAGLQPYAPGPHLAGMGGGSSRLSKEVFGFALGSSLSDPTLGYPSWNFNLLTTVAYFGLHVNWDGTFANDSGWAVWNSSQLSNLVSTAHAHGTKVVLTIIQGDSRPTFPNTMCNTLSNWPTAVAKTVAEVKAKGVDGVNVDFEGVNQSCTQSDPSWARHALTNFVAQLRSALGGGYYLSIDTYSGAAGDPYDFMDIGGLNPYVDSFFVMAYDMEYSNWHHPPTNCGNFCMGPTSPLTTYYYNDTDVMSQYSSTVTASKVILGIPYYGRKACVSPAIANEHPIGGVIADMYVNASGESTDPSVKSGTYAAHRDANDPSGQERWDTWYSTSASCWRELYWDDVTSLGLKYDLINKDGLRGVGIWNLNYGGGSAELWASLASHFGGWAATYDMSKAPTGWGVKQTQTFPVTVTNTGTIVWPSRGTNEVDLDLHFAGSAGGFLNQGAWVTSQAFALPADVGPNQSVTVNVTVTAPSSAGSFVLEAEMIKEHEFWFTQYQPVNVNVSTWVASYDMSQAPTSWAAGQSQNVKVTVNNIGGATWPSTGFNEVDLDLHFATSAGGAPNQSRWLTSQAFSLPADVNPGAGVTVTVKVTAPATNGSMVLEAEMIKEHEFWFQQWGSANVSVASPAWSATYNMSKVPNAWTLGQSQTFPVTVTNTGNQTWTSTGYTAVDVDVHFAGTAGGSAQQGTWMTSQAVSLPADLAPGQSATVSFTISAPRSGVYVLEAEMIKEHAFWFQQFAPITVAAAPAGWSATYDLSKAPTSWVAGKSQTFSVTVTNNGTQTWPSGGYSEVDLELHFATSWGGAQNQANWVTNNAFALPKDVSPGQSVTVQVTVTPPHSGSYMLEAEMISEHHFWFLQSSAINAPVA